MPAAFIRPIIFVARSCSLGVGRVGLKQTAFEGESVARPVVQLLERKLTELTEDTPSTSTSSSLGKKRVAHTAVSAPVEKNKAKQQVPLLNFKMCTFPFLW